MADTEDDHIAWFNAIKRVINSLKQKKIPPMLLEVGLDGLRLRDPQTDEVSGRSRARLPLISTLRSLRSIRCQSCAIGVLLLIIIFVSGSDGMLSSR
jgi:hypothetical protein